MLILNGVGSTVYALAFSPDGRVLAAGTKEGHVWAWDEGYERQELWAPSGEPDGGVNAIDFDPTNEAVVIGHGSGWVGRRIADGRTFGPGKPARVVGVPAVKFLSPTLLAVGFGHRAKEVAGALELWDLSSERRREPVFPAPKGVRAVAALPARNLVAWAEWGRRVSVWELTRAEPVRFNLPHNCLDLALCPSGRLLAAAVEYRVSVFDLTRPNERLLNAGRSEWQTLTGHTGKVTAVAFSPDGRTVASGSWDQTVRIWDMAAGRERAVFQWGIGKVFSLTYSPDGLRLAAGGDKGAVAVWDVG